MANLIFRKNGTNYTIDGLIAGTGHLIKNSSGQEVTDRQYLQFNGAYLGDDSVGDATKVNIVRTMTQSQFNNLSAAEKEGLIYISDAAGQLTASEVALAAIAGMSATTVQSGISELNSDKVEKSGDTMTGMLTIDRSAESSPQRCLALRSGANGISYATFFDKNNVHLGSLGFDAKDSPVFRKEDGTKISLIGGARTVTTLVDETVSIAANASKTYSALTATALQAYDEIHFLANFSNVFVNGMTTKEQMQAITAYTSPANGRLWFFAANMSASIDYTFRIRADANGLQIINGSSATALDNLRIYGIKYN